MPNTTYSIVEFTVAKAGLETTYGDATGVTLEALPVYNATEPLVAHDQGSEAISLADSSLGPSQFYTTEPFYRMTATTYVYCTDRSNPPPWASVLLPISGFLKGKIDGAAPDLGASGLNPTFTQTPQSGAVSAGVYKYTFTLVDFNTGFETKADATGVSVNVTGVDKKIDISLSNIPAGKFVRCYRTKAGGSTYYFLGVAYPTGTSASFSDIYHDSKLVIAITAPLTADDGSTLFTPKNEHFDSAVIDVFLHSHKRRMLGSRGTWTIDAEAGRALATRWEIRGIYSPATAESNPNVGNLNPGIPFIFRNVTAVLHQQGSNNPISPFVVKRMSLTPGTQLDNRRDASSSTAIREIGIHRRYDARLELSFEVDRNFSFDAIDAYDKMAEFDAAIRVGSNPSVVFQFPRLQISEAPRLESQDGGILSWGVVFRPRNHSGNDFMRIYIN